MELAFAALQQLCAPMLGRLDRLPAPQRTRSAWRSGCGPGMRRIGFWWGWPAPSLFSEAVEKQPLLCVVDDAQWLDRVSAQALVFVARRLLAESVALLFATREASEELDGLPKLAVEALRDGDARALLGSAVRVPLDERVRERMVAETRGNPLALLELPRGLTAGGARRRVRLAGRAGAIGADRGQLSPQARGAAGGHPAAVAGRGGRAGGRSGAGVAGSRAARDRGSGGGRHRRLARDRRAGDLSSPAGPLGRLSRGLAGGQARRASCAGRRHRP